MELSGREKAKLVIGVILLALAGFTWIGCPIPYLWYATVGAPELGFYVAVAAIPLLVGRSLVPTRILALLIMVLALWPWGAALLVANQLPARLQQAFGGNPAVRHPLRGLPWAPDCQIIDRDNTTTYLPPTPPQPVTVLEVHSGGWRGGTRRESKRLDAYLASQGWKVVAVDYRLAPAHPHPAGLEDVERLLRELAKERPVVLVGRSAGGHLALCAAYRNPTLVAGVMAIYAPTDLLWDYDHPSNPAAYDSRTVISNYMGGPPGLKPERYQAASPVYLAGPDTPPTLIVHGLRDDLVWPANADRLAARLAQQPTPYLQVELPWMNHGGDLVPGGPSSRLCAYALESFLTQLGMKRAASGKVEFNEQS